MINNGISSENQPEGLILEGPVKRGRGGDGVGGGHLGPEHTKLLIIVVVKYSDELLGLEDSSSNY